MKFKFIKSNEDIEIKLCDDVEQDFDYVTMIELLYKTQCMEKSAFEGDAFTNEEKERLENLVQEISEKIISKTKSCDNNQAVI